MKCKKYYKDPDAYVAYRNRWKKRYRMKTGSYCYNPREWTIEELQMVQDHKILDRELSKKINRSVQAIQTARCRLKKGELSID